MSQPPQTIYVQYQPRPATNGLALAGLVLGLVAAAIGLIPLLGWFMSSLPALLAIIFGFIGIATANANDGLRRKEAIAAVWLGFTPTLIAIAFFVYAVLFRGNST